MNVVANLNLAGGNKPGTCLDTGGIGAPVASAQEVSSVARDRRRADGKVVRDGWSSWRSSNAFSIQILLARSGNALPARYAIPSVLSSANAAPCCLFFEVGLKAFSGGNGDLPPSRNKEAKGPRVATPPTAFDTH